MKKTKVFTKSVRFLAVFMVVAMILSSMPLGGHAGFEGVFGLDSDLKAAMEEIVSYYADQGGELTDWEQILNLKGAGVDLYDGRWTLPDWDSDTFGSEATAGFYGSRILALIAMEKNPEDFDNRDLIAELVAMQQDDGSFLVGTDQMVTSQIFAMHALDVAGAAYEVEEALNWLTGQINDDGGIGWGVGAASDVDTTGWLARLLAGHSGKTGVDEALTAARSYLGNKQLESGGFASAYSGENANSTANGLLGFDVSGTEAATALERLYDFESDTAGFYRFKLEDSDGSAFATKQVLGAFGDFYFGTPVFERLAYGWDTLGFTLRVEGAEATLLDESFGYQILSDDAPTVEDVVAKALDEKEISYTNAGGYLSEIAGETAGSFGGFDGWLYRVNGESQAAGIADTAVKEGDDILFYYGEMAPGTLYPETGTSPDLVYDGDEITFSVSATYDVYDDEWQFVATTTAAVSGAVVTLREEGSTGALEVLSTDDSGLASATLAAGSYEYRVSKEEEGAVPFLVRTRWLPLEVSPPVTTRVDLRIEGIDGTLYDEEVAYKGHPEPTVEAVLAATFDFESDDFTWTASEDGYFINELFGETADYATDGTWWAFIHNGASSMTGISGTKVAEGDDIVLARSDAGTLIPEVTLSPDPVYDGEEITIKVSTSSEIYDDAWNVVGTTTAAVTGALVRVVDGSDDSLVETLETDDDGQVTMNLDAGSYEYRVSKDEAGEAPRLVRTQWLPLEVNPLVTTRVDLRIEGIDGTLYDGEVAYKGHPDPTVEAVLAATFDFESDDFTWTGSEYGYFINELFGETADYATDGTWWAFIHNGVSSMTGVSGTTVAEGDDIVLARSDAGTLIPEVTLSPDPVYDGDELTFSVTVTYDVYDDAWQFVETTTAAVTGALVRVVDGSDDSLAESLVTDGDGQVTMRLDDGSYEYRVSKDVAGEAPELVRTAWLPLSVRAKPVSAGPDPVGRTDVDVAVIGSSGQVIFGPEEVRLYVTDEFGETAMGALDATGLSWEFKEHGFIYKIDGMANEGMLGWKYAVNGVVPGVSSLDFDLDEGDRVLWWYALESANEAAPQWPKSREDSDSTLTEILDSEGQIERMKAWAETIDGERTLIGEDRSMSLEEAGELAAFLEDHTVDMESAYDGQEVLMDDGEVSLLVGEGALEGEARLTVEELTVGEAPRSFGIRFNSAVYDFGPDGTGFEEPVVIGLKIPVDGELDLETLAPAYYDETKEKWVTIPYVLDLESGQVIFEVDHFTWFALIGTPERRGFEDLTENYGWAREAVEILAGREIISGSGKGFEPGRLITRAEFAKILVSALDLETGAGIRSPFQDVEATHWSYPYLARGYEEGLISGYPDGTFRPQAAISRYEIAALLSRIGEAETPEQGDIFFADADDVPEWAGEAVSQVADSGLMKGYDDGSFKGRQGLTRAEAAVVMYRYLSLKE